MQDNAKLPFSLTKDFPVCECEIEGQKYFLKVLRKNFPVCELGFLEAFFVIAIDYIFLVRLFK